MSDLLKFRVSEQFRNLNRNKDIDKMFQQVLSIQNLKTVVPYWLSLLQKHKAQAGMAGGILALFKLRGRGPDRKTDTVPTVSVEGSDRERLLR